MFSIPVVITIIVERFFEGKSFLGFQLAATINDLLLFNQIIPSPLL